MLGTNNLLLSWKGPFARHDSKERYDCIVFHVDQAERHDLKSPLWLFFSPFIFPLKKEGRRKGV